MEGENESEKTAHCRGIFYLLYDVLCPRMALRSLSGGCGLSMGFFQQRGSVRSVLRYIRLRRAASHPVAVLAAETPYLRREAPDHPAAGIHRNCCAHNRCRADRQLYHGVHCRRLAWGLPKICFQSRRTYRTDSEYPLRHRRNGSSLFAAASLPKTLL